MSQTMELPRPRCVDNLLSRKVMVVRGVRGQRGRGRQAAAEPAPRGRATASGRRATAAGIGKPPAGTEDWFVSSNWLRRTLNTVYPDHWSFVLGQIAIYSFIVLLLSGIYLMFFFDPSMREVTYEGSYAPLRGVDVSAAYDSVLDLSFDVRGGLFMRQLHHWAALLFVAAIVLHLLRVFFTGGFRRPRGSNWIIIVGLLALALLDGVTGYTVVDDLLSGTSLRIISAIILSIPLIGMWAHFALFDGDFPGEVIIGRLYVLHVLLVPGILLALVAVHLLLTAKQKRTQFPGPERTESSASACSRRTPARPPVCSSWCSASAPSSAAWCRSTRCGCGARTTRRTCRRPRSRTGTRCS